jgi:ribosomal protein L6P/L9E
MLIKKQLTFDNSINLNFRIFNSKKFFFYNINNSFVKYYFCPEKIFFSKEDNTYTFFSKQENAFFLESFLQQFSFFTHNVVKKSKKKLILKGLGYKCFFSDDKKSLIFKIGYSHLISVVIPKTITSVIIEKTFIVIEGLDSIILGNFCKKIKELKPLDIYKGKGIRYKNDFIKLKAIKKTK